MLLPNSSPVLVLASNMTVANEDTEAGIQLAYQQPTTEGLKKYGKRLITPKRIHEYGAYAFRQLRSGLCLSIHEETSRRPHSRH